jgi:tetratricopeptide (TPR) repeat protein
MDMRPLPLIIVAVLFAGQSAYASQQNFTKGKKVGASFLEVNRSLRRSALGGDQVAAIGDSEALHSNPAALVGLSMPEFSISQTQSFLNSQEYAFSFAAPLQHRTLGFGGFYRDDGSAERVTVNQLGEPVRGGDFRYSTLLLQGSWSAPLTSRLSTGLSLKGWQDKQGQTSSTGFAGDLGFVMSSVFSNFDLAGTVRNLGPSTQDGQLPTSYIVGGTVRLPILSFYSQAEFSSHRGMDTRFGLEYRNDRFWVGGGYQTLTGDLNQSIAHFPLGGGIRVKDYSFDYTWTPGGELGDQHRIGLKMAFGQSDAQKRDLARQVDQQMEARMKQHADTLYEEADAALLTGRLEEAQKKLSQSLLWNPQRKESLAQLKLVENKLALKKSAEEKELRKALKDDAAYQAHVLEKENEALHAKLEEANRVSTVSDEQTAKMNRDAYTLFMLGQTEQAIKIWQKILIDQPNNAEAKRALDQAREKQRLVSSGEGKLASRVYELNSKALGAYSRGELKEAAQIWRDALRIDAGNVWIKNNLDRVEREMVTLKTSKKDVE